MENNIKISKAELEKDKELKFLLRKINKERGLDCNQYRITYIHRRLMTRLRANQIENFVEYARFLDHHPEEYSYLINALTINVTNFFRDTSVYQIFKTSVLPRLISKKKTRKQRLIRIWSAGCASGEEPYSIAIVVKEVLGLKNKDLLVSIYATDYDHNSLSIAKAGVYSEDKLKNISEKYLRRYFKNNGNYKVKPIIKSIVKFKNLDLFAENPIKYVDIIFCRNVLIYFTREQQRDLVKKFYDALLNGGYLILGKSEKLVDHPEVNFITLNGPERIFQKSANINYLNFKGSE